MSDSNPTISVVIPCMNSASTLGESLESILGQSFGDIEVVWFDDGSTDSSLAMAQAYAARDSRVRVLPSKHVGIVEALRQGCAAARGPLIARMDADDVAHPGRLAKQVACLEAHPEVGVCGTQVRTLGDALGSGRLRYEEWLNGLVTHEDMMRELLVECPIAHPSMMIRREVLEAVGGYVDRGWPEDYDLVLRCALEGVRMGKVAEPLLNWRDGVSRLSMRDSRYSPEKFREVKRHYLDRAIPRNGRRLYQWGAGEVGKKWLAEWGEDGPVAAVDINPRKFGKTIHGTLVIAPEELPGPEEAYTVVAVGAPGARADIREWFGTRGYGEMRDYAFLA